MTTGRLKQVAAQAQRPRFKDMKKRSPKRSAGTHRGVAVESGADSNLERLAVAFDVEAARRRVGNYQRDAQLSCLALRARLLAENGQQQGTSVYAGVAPSTDALGMHVHA